MPRKPRRRPFGSITTVNRNKHVIRWTQDTPQGRKRLSRTVYGTYREADAELARLFAGLGGDGPTKTVVYVHDRWWLPDIERKSADKGRPKRSTIDKYEEMWRTHVYPRWGDVPVSKIRRLDVQEWLRSLAESVGKLCIVVLRGIIESAVKYEEVESNNLRGVEFEYGDRKIDRDASVYSLRDADALFADLCGSIVEAPFIMACFGGARTGESLGAMCRDVELREMLGVKLAVVPIVRQMPETGCAPKEYGDLKNPQSVRHAVIPEPYGTRLYEIACDNMARGIEWLADRGDGLPMNKMTLKRHWDRACGANRIPFANLRPSWRTFAQFEWRLDHDTMELLMGHKLHGITGKHYLRPGVDDLVKSVAESMAAFADKRKT